MKNDITNREVNPLVENPIITFQGTGKGGPKENGRIIPKNQVEKHKLDRIAQIGV